MGSLDIPPSPRLYMDQRYQGFDAVPPCAPPNRPLPPVPQIDTPARGYQLPLDACGIENSTKSIAHGFTEEAPSLSWQYGPTFEYHALSTQMDETVDTVRLWPFDDPKPWLLLPELGGVKRNSPEDFIEEPVARPLKTARMAEPADTELATLTLDEYYHGLVLESAHLDRGHIDGRFHCSCGKSYTRKFRLNDHLESSNGGARYSCSLCPMAFNRDDTRIRHERTAHQGDKWPCPMCSRPFRADYLRKHLRSKGNGCREALSAAFHSQGTPEGNPFAETVYQESSTTELTREQPARQPQSSRASSGTIVRNVDVRTPTVECFRNHPTRAKPACVYRLSREPCNICGEKFGPDEDALRDHLERHTVELANRPFRCEECAVDFAFAGDLARHRKRAASGHCGFDFDHDACQGHHAHHEEAMRHRLIAWETFQIRAHRIAILQLLLDRLQYQRIPRFSLDDCSAEMSYLKTLDRFSKISIDSFRSVPAWMKTGDNSDVEELARQVDDLAKHFESLDTCITDRNSLVVPSRPRPESMVLAIGSGLQLALKEQHMPPNIHNTRADITGNRRTTYSQMVGNLRKPFESPGPSQNRFSQAINNATRFL